MPIIWVSLKPFKSTFEFKEFSKFLVSFYQFCIHITEQQDANEYNNDLVGESLHVDMILFIFDN